MVEKYGKYGNMEKIIKYMRLLQLRREKAEARNVMKGFSVHVLKRAMLNLKGSVKLREKLYVYNYSKLLNFSFFYLSGNS